ncbi:MAG: EamA family transporter, partial [Comamonadaceae bacterium]
MQALSRKQLILLVLLTLVWGINWPVMKVGVTEYPPLTFRAISIWLGLPLLAIALVVLKVPFRVKPGQWRELVGLSATNMF